MPDVADRLQTIADFTRSTREQQIQPEGVSPTASPVSTFTAPHGGAELEQLASSLAKISPAVAQYSDLRARQGQERDQADATAAVSEAVRNGQNTYAAAVKSGAIPASASPWYRLYAKKQFGQLMAGQMASDFTAAVGKDLATATDLGQYDKYAQAFQKTWLEQHAGEAVSDPAFSDGFNPSANAAMANARERFADEAGKRLQQYTASTLIQTTAQSIREGKAQGLSDDAIAAKITQAGVDGVQGAGMNGDVANAAIAQGIANAAEAAGDPTLLKLAAKVKAGTGYLQDTNAFQQASEHSLAYITKQQMDADVAARQARTNLVEATRQSVLTDGFGAIEKDPKADLRPLFSQLEKIGDYAGEVTLQTWQKAAQSSDWAGDKDTMASFFQRATNPDGPTIDMREVASALHDGQGGISFGMANELRGILDEREQRAKSDAKETSVYKDPNYRVAYSNVTERMKGLGLLGDSQNTARAHMALYNAMSDLQNNPDYVKNPRSPANRAIMSTIVDDVVHQYGGRTIQRVDAKSAANAAANAPSDATRSNAPNMDEGHLFAQRILREKLSPTGLSASTRSRMAKMGLTTPQAISSFFAEHGVIPPHTDDNGGQ